MELSDMDWVRDRIREALDSVRMDIAAGFADVPEPETIGALRGEVAMLRAELSEYRMQPSIIEVAGTGETQSESMEAVTEAVTDIAEAASAIVEAAENVAIDAVETALANDEAESDIDTDEPSTPSDDVPVERGSFWTRPLFGGR